MHLYEVICTQRNRDTSSRIPIIEDVVAFHIIKRSRNIIIREWFIGVIRKFHLYGTSLVDKMRWKVDHQLKESIKKKFCHKIVFVCLYITPSHYHHCANLSEDIELIKRLSDIFCRVCEQDKAYSPSYPSYKTWGCVFSVYHFPCDDWENIYTLSYFHHQIGSMNYYPLFRARLWNNGVSCMSSCNPFDCRIKVPLCKSIYILQANETYLYKCANQLRYAW